MRIRIQCFPVLGVYRVSLDAAGRIIGAGQNLHSVTSGRQESAPFARVLLAGRLCVERRRMLCDRNRVRFLGQHLSAHFECRHNNVRHTRTRWRYVDSRLCKLNVRRLGGNHECAGLDVLQRVRSVGVRCGHVFPVQNDLCIGHTETVWLRQYPTENTEAGNAERLLHNNRPIHDFELNELRLNVELDIFVSIEEPKQILAGRNTIEFILAVLRRSHATCGLLVECTDAGLDCVRCDRSGLAFRRIALTPCSEQKHFEITISVGHFALHIVPGNDERVSWQLGISIGNGHQEIGLLEMETAATHLNTVLAGNDWRERENSTRIGHRSAYIVAVQCLQFDGHVFHGRCSVWPEYPAGDAEPFECEIDIVAFAANVGFPIEIDIDLFRLEAPAGRRRNFQCVLAFVVDRQKVVAVRWRTIRFVFQTSLFREPANVSQFSN